MTNKSVYRLLMKFLCDGNTNDVISYRGQKLIAQSNTPGWAILILDDKEHLSNKDLAAIDFWTQQVTILDHNYEQPIREAIEDYTGSIIWPKQQFVFN